MSVRTWTCQRVTAGVKCGHVNPAKYQICRQCLKRKPKRREPAHRAALKLSYEDYLALNGGIERCGVCGVAPKPGRRLHRDHDHRLQIPRGLACFPCNAALRPYMDAEWLENAAAYVRRAMKAAGMT